MKQIKFSSITIIVLIRLLYLIGCSGVSENTTTSEVTSTSTEPDSHEGHNHEANEGHGSADENQVLDWCVEHAVPESKCTQCNPSLIASFKESGDWCLGHELPGSHCRLCNPGIIFPQETIIAQQNAEITATEIDVSLFFRPNTDICATNDALIQFATEKTAGKAGISIERVRQAQFKNSITAPAETVFDEGSLVYITSTVKASVSKWLKSPGDFVNKGEKIAVVSSPEIAQLKSSLISKHATYTVQTKELERHSKMFEKNLISQADYEYQKSLTEQARAEMISIEGMLLSAGLKSSDIEDVKLHGTVDYSYDLLAPSSGVLVERKAQLGELLDAGSTFAQLADPQAMWINAELSENQLRDVTLGQKLLFSSDGKGLHNVGGEIIWISRLLDPHSRTGTVRAKVIDRNHQLKANEFGRVTIAIENNHEITLVPKDAVQWEGCCNVVFVKESDTRYRPRKVELVNGEGPYYQVLNGLHLGDDVVVSGSFLLKTELKKSSIGAGCCGIEPTI